MLLLFIGLKAFGETDTVPSQIPFSTIYWVWPNNKRYGRCWFLGWKTLFSQFYSPPRSMNGYRRTVGQAWRNVGGITCDRHPIKGGVGMHLVDSCNRNQDKLWLNKPLPTSTDFTSCCRNQLFRQRTDHYFFTSFRLQRHWIDFRRTTWLWRSYIRGNFIFQTHKS